MRTYCIARQWGWGSLAFWNEIISVTVRICSNTRGDSTYRHHHSQYQNQIDYVICSQIRRGSIQSEKTRPGADCGSDHELLIAKFRFKLKNLGKTTRPLRYDLNQVLYEYTVEVKNRFKGLDLIDRVPDELWMKVHNIVQEVVIKTIFKKRNAKRQNGCLRRP